MANDREQLLKELKQNKRNRSAADLGELLSSWGFACRRTKKGHSVWTKQDVKPITLPEPHGRDPVMLLPYVQNVIRRIEECKEMEAATGKEAEDEEES